MFETLNKIVSDFFNLSIFQNNKKTNKKTSTKKVGRPKKIFTEKDCEVSYLPELLYLMNMPGEYVEYEEI